MDKLNKGWFIEANKEILGSIHFIIFLLFIGILSIVFLASKYSPYWMIASLPYGYAVIIYQQWLYRRIEE